MLLNPDTFSPQAVQALYEEGKFWAALGAASWALFRIVNWITDIRKKDLKELHTGVSDLKSVVQEQTVVLANELRELRSDFRVFYTPHAAQARALKPRPKTAARNSKAKVKPAARPKRNAR